MIGEEIKKELQEGLLKFVFEPVAAALSMIEKEMKKILRGHGIHSADVDVRLVNNSGYGGVDTTISFDGNIMCMRLTPEI